MLADNLKILLASTFSYYIKASFMHWNVTGPNFVQYHQLFGEIYEGAQESIDTIAEEIRTLRSHAPGSLSRYQELSIIEDQTMIPRCELMVEELLSDTISIIDLVNQCLMDSKAEEKSDIENHMAELLAFYNKYRWQLESCVEHEE
jgi:starvation-inducible DNA-binding protein